MENIILTNNKDLRLVGVKVGVYSTLRFELPLVPESATHVEVIVTSGDVHSAYTATFVSATKFWQCDIAASQFPAVGKQSYEVAYVLDGKQFWDGKGWIEIEDATTRGIEPQPRPEPYRYVVLSVNGYGADAQGAVRIPKTFIATDSPATTDGFMEGDIYFNRLTGATWTLCNVQSTLTWVFNYKNYYTKAETDEAIDKLAAYYITADAQGNPFATKAALVNAQTYYSGGAVRTPTRNDYAVVLADETNVGAEWRYIYAVDAQGVGQWEPQYPIETNDYNALSNKPQINGNTLSGNKTLSDLGAFSSVDPSMDGTASAGVAETAARSDHVHPAETAVLPPGYALPASAFPVSIYGRSTSDPADIELFDATAGSGYVSWLDPSYGEVIAMKMSWQGQSDHALAAFNKSSGAFINGDGMLSFNGNSGVEGVSPVLTARDSTVIVRGVEVASRVANATAGNLAALDANGNPTDSLIPAANVAMKAEVASADTKAEQALANAVIAQNAADEANSKAAQALQTIPYSLGTPIVIDTASSEVVEGETVYYGEATLANRTANIVQVTATLDELRITFPAETSGKMRDFGLRVEIGTGSAALAAPALVPIAPTGETIKIENNAAEIPALADGTATAKGVTLLYFSETAQGVFVVKGEQVEEV